MDKVQEETLEKGLIYKISTKLSSLQRSMEAKESMNKYFGEILSLMDK
jgi:hypothetical protein